MANWTKKADMFVIDIGHSMAEVGVDRTENNLDWSLKFVWNKIGRKILSARATDELGVIAFRTIGTDVPIKEDKRAGYEHISVLSPIQKYELFLMEKQKLNCTRPSMRMLQYLQEELQVSLVNNEGDAISAICIAIQLIEDYCKQKKYDRKIYLVTDGKGPADPDDWDLINQRLQGNQIELVICGVDFDDPEYGVKEEDKPSVKRVNEEIYRRICRISAGTFITVNELVDGLEDPDVEVTRSTSTYSGNLTIGNPDDPESLSIAINRYLATRVQAAPTTQSYSAELRAPLTDSVDEDLKTHKVEQHRIYRIPAAGPNEPDEEIDKDDVHKGFKYGKSIVPISQEEESLLQYPCKKGYEIIGFVSEDQVLVAILDFATDHLVSEIFIHVQHPIHISRKNQCASSGYYALARLVKKDDQSPTLVVLCPFLTEGVACLVEAEAPFAEDCRHYKFASLDRVKNIKGEILSQHPHIPNQQQLDAMSDYVDSLDLSKGTESEIQLFRCENNYNPVLGNIRRAILHRAIHRDDTLPELPRIVQSLFQMPADVVERSAEALGRLKIASNVKKVPPKSKKRKMEQVQGNKPLSGLDVEETLSKGAEIKRDRQETREIGYEDPAGDFQRMLENSGQFDRASAQLKVVLPSLVETSFSSSNYDKVIEALKVFRERAIEEKKGHEFEGFLREFERDIGSGKLGGDREALGRVIREQQESQE
ncbi:ATP-dependent DNA helicase II subunit 2 [Neolecta irregularis DAH-3]|uniref:ATP-dependent DNA helicase II subunit 2 n=1 Tax=Neolecta irregularis (strain DAH-3) TaxID=1198029 RepID=A0A1U7LWM6_NEOID|nr:ATP-dependent DNA helicase II subunit 2 [Neolecta irregularis DAH-3]|eukprot:OLL26973.1 ATP-dependent DNA helicase II subunit 2 [Neolecta irregularis DAH-3]